MFWVWFQFKHVFWVLKRTVSSERWDGSFEYPRQVFVVKKPSYMSFTHSYLEVWFFFSCTFSKKILQWRQRTVEAHCLKFWNLFCKPIPMRRRICISMLCYRLLYWPKTCSGDLCIFRRWDINSSDVYAQLSSGTRYIFVTSFPSHTSTSMRRRASKILDALLQGQE